LLWKGHLKTSTNDDAGKMFLNAPYIYNGEHPHDSGVTKSPIAQAFRASTHIDEH
jgi:hypothetical protein